MLDVDEIHTYYGDSHVLQGISLTVNEGEVVAVLGRNGAGKTTTMYSIVGFQKPREGTITFNGADITDEPPYEIARRGISLVPQERRLFPNLTVLENLTLGVRNNHEKDSDWTLERIFNLFPNLKERQSNLAFQLSGGEQQMTAIGRALLTNPDLLLLDEPSEGLAPSLVDKVEDVIHTLKEDRSLAILIVEQNLPMTTSVADRAYVIEKGRNIFEGTTEELKESQDLLKL